MLAGEAVEHGLLEADRRGLGGQVLVSDDRVEQHRQLCELGELGGTLVAGGDVGANGLGLVGLERLEHVAAEEYAAGRAVGGRSVHGSTPISSSASRSPRKA